LFREKGEDKINGDVNIYSILHNTIEEVRFASRKTSGTYLLHRHVPRFTASKCKIIIEPEWLIEEVYTDRGERNTLQQVVNEINSNSQLSCVEVIYADISRERLEKSMRKIQQIEK